MKGAYGLIGEKLGHSFSPQIHAELADYDYQLYELAADELAAFMRDTELAGFNVTIPYKQAVMPYCAALSERAQAIGSVNTVVRQADGSWLGDNTDYCGFDYLLRKSGCEVKGRKALVLGSGGAAKTVCAVLRDAGAQVVVISRSGEDNYDNLDRHHDAGLIVNTTPLGMYPKVGAAALAPADFPHCAAVLDVVYNPARTELLLRAEEAGIPAYNGLRMLVAQAKAAAELFIGEAIDDSELERITAKIEAETGNIVLIGMPGCGKSSTGCELERMTGRKLVDTDSMIEQRWGKSCAELINEQGEAAFRAKESEVLAEAAAQSGLIIACGGGIVIVPGNRRLLRMNSSVVYIKRQLKYLPTANRPLSQREGLEKLFAERRPLYESWADIEVENRDPISAAQQIRKELKI